MKRLSATLLLVCAACASPAYATEGSLTNSGGSATAGTGVSITSSVASPLGTLMINCPSTGSGGCTGGSFDFLSADGSTSISATFESGSAIESCYGGGRGGTRTCYYNVTGNFTGTLTLTAKTQVIIGVTSQSFKIASGSSASGTSAYNSAYSPFYYSDTEQILRSDDLAGTNQITYGGQGGGTGGFYGAYGIALDTLGRIYVADTYNCRVVRMDNMQGANWTTYGGTCGSAQGEFYDPQGIAVDSAGRIYVMDTGNTRFVRINDMTGAGWTTFGTVGSGVNQFLSFIWVTVDTANHIYVADTGNRRIARFDDMTGTNWTVLSQSQPTNGVSNTFMSPVAVAVDASGGLYVADNPSAAAVIHVTDMAGNGWTSIAVSPIGSTGLNSISVDASGAAFTGGGGVRIVDNMAGVLTSSGTVGPIGTYYVFGVTPVPAPSWPPSAISFSPTTLNFSTDIGTTSAAQSVTMSNFGGNTLNLSDISVSSGFAETINCTQQIVPGSNCTVDISFTASAARQVNGSLTVTDDSGNAGTTQSVALTGVGTAPAASVSPTSLTFSTLLGSESAPQSVTLQNTGTETLQVSSITASAPFNQTNDCVGSVAPGGICTIMVSFEPTAMGTVPGTLTISDTAGIQAVRLSGTGSGLVTVSPTLLSFGTVKVGRTSTAKKVTLTNLQSVALNFSSITATTQFAIASDTCGTSISAGAKCTVGLIFKPSAKGTVTGTLSFIDGAANSPQTVGLSGSGK